MQKYPIKSVLGFIIFSKEITKNNEKNLNLMIKFLNIHKKRIFNAISEFKLNSLKSFVGYIS